MLRKPITGLLLLGGAIGGPYVVYETDIGRSAQMALTPGQVESSEVAPAGLLTSTHSQSSPAVTAQMQPPHVLNGTDTPAPNTPVLTLAEVARFDITPAWITARFPRVSTVVGNEYLDGMRVPLVTGTTPTDLAGTLTYYFDHYQRLQRISIQGVTGNPNRFISELQRGYKLEQQPSLGGNLYLLNWNGKATSVLRVSPAAIIRADAPYSRFDLFLELNQPGLQFGLSGEARGMLDAGRAARRW